MKLREHPGISIWPPPWLALSGSHEKKSPGEAGTLVNVTLSRVDPVTICYLTIQYEDEQFMGTLLCKESNLCLSIHDLLKNSFGKSIREIGDLELPDVLG
jgi:hypothetical protein